MGRAHAQQLALEYGEIGATEVASSIRDLKTLLSICADLIGADCMSHQERDLAAQYRTPVDRALVAAVRSAIEQGCDPLGAAYCTLHSPAERRAAGQTFTPRTV